MLVIQMTNPDLSSDEALRRAVKAALAGNAQTEPLALRVGVQNGVAHLAGRAPDSAAWRLAAQLATETPGIRGVVNRIEAPGAPAPSRTIHLSRVGRYRRNRARKDKHENHQNHGDPRDP